MIFRIYYDAPFLSVQIAQEFLRSAFTVETSGVDLIAAVALEDVQYCGAGWQVVDSDLLGVFFPKCHGAKDDIDRGLL